MKEDTTENLDTMNIPELLDSYLAMKEVREKRLEQVNHFKNLLAEHDTLLNNITTAVKKKLSAMKNPPDRIVHDGIVFQVKGGFVMVGPVTSSKELVNAQE